MAWFPSAQGASESAWQSVPGGRSLELSVPAAGHTGFTLLSAAQTGLAFTNTLEEWQGASNRVLFNGSGVAAGDYDNDGWPDLFFCGLNTPNQLYRNLGGWKFKEVTAEAGLAAPGQFDRGAVFADINGDGTLDLLVATTGQGVRCFLNDGRGRFTDATRGARTASPHGSVTLALADVDGNGTLDLYVANNRTADMRDRGQVDLHLVNGRVAVPPALKDRFVILQEQVLEYGEPDQLYLNDGKGRFTPVSWTGGRFRNEEGGPLTQPPLDWGLTATFRDINDDGFPDLYVCNDFWTPDRLWLNDGKGRFRAAPRLALRNTCASSMGIDFADLDRDGDLDAIVLDMLSRDPRLRKRQKLAQPPMPSPIGAIEDRPQFMRNTLLVNRGDDTFAELAHYAGVAASEWSWSPVFLDVDLDGYEDLLITSGHAKDVQDLDAAAQIRSRQRSWKGFTNEVARQKAFTQELMEHMRLYPRLDTPIVAFRNRGDLRFEDVTPRWGTEQPGIHHAIALADFDRDGDLDFAVNNLGSAAGLYRNESSAPRLTVRLKGRPPNVQGIGAKVRLLGGAVPVQSQEVIAGGRYMAGSEPVLVFAAGANRDGMKLEVVWRSGRRSLLTNVQANCLYEIDEKESVVSSQLSVAEGHQRTADNGTRSTEHAARTPLFKDVSSLLNHSHHEGPFDDFARQPLLPRRLSQLGPGVSWFDVDADGREDLIVASGRGGRMACFRNNGQGGFVPMTQAPLDKPVTRDQTTVLGWRAPSGATVLLAGSANYEDGLVAGSSVRLFDLGRKVIDDTLPGDAASTGPLALGDVESDGDLDLFVGGRVLPGRYPEAASSRLFRFDGGRFQLDSTNSKALERVGLVSGAVWSDLDVDGLPELVLACEWGPVKIFRNEKGKLAAWDPRVESAGGGKGAGGKRGKGAEEKRAAGDSLPLFPFSPFPPCPLSQLTGWWSGVTTGDLDGDGRMDIVAANWGLNSDYAASIERPLLLHYGDLSGRGAVDILETEWDPRANALTLRRRLDALAGQWPALQERFGSHLAYSKASLAEVLGPDRTRAHKVEAATLASMVFLNRGDRFEAVPLPPEAQWAPALGVNVADFDGDGHEDVFLSQNFFATQPETPRLDAGRGLLLRGDGTGRLEPVPGPESGLLVYGEQRGAAVADFDGDGQADLAVGQNGSGTKLFLNQAAKPGLRVRLSGTEGNPQSVGATLRLKFDSRSGPAREIHAGSGYWSQDGATQVLGLPEAPTHLWIRWPGGRTSSVAVPPNAKEINVAPTGIKPAQE
jgi:hypothetical protein